MLNQTFAQATSVYKRAISVESGKTYKIVNLKAGTVIDLELPNGTLVIGYDWHNGDNQKWIVEINEGGQWSLKNKYRGTYLGVVPSLVQGYANGLRLIGGFSNPFAWEAYHNAEYGNAYYLKLPGYNFNIDLSSHGAIYNGAPITLWDNSGTQNQIWRFEEVDN